MAEISFRLSKREAKALAEHRGHGWHARPSQDRLSAERKMREAIWSAFPDLRESNQDGGES